MPSTRSSRVARAARSANAALPSAQAPMVMARNGPTVQGKAPLAQSGKANAGTPNNARATAAASSNHLRHLSSSRTTSIRVRPGIHVPV